MAASEPDGFEFQVLNDVDRVIHTPPRLTILAYLYVVESADFIFLMRLCELTWGNLSSHLSKLEESGYIDIRKEFVEKRPHTMIALTSAGREAFKKYKQNLKQALDQLPE
jgi:DNA-binding MarR family transcriptional regulator